MSDAIKPFPTKGYTRTNCAFPPVGPGEMVLPRGRIAFVDVPGLTLLDVRNDEGVPISAAIIAYCPDEPVGQGFLAQMDAQSARKFAAALLGIADQIEPARLDA
jgi:hypothetical protein